MHNTIEGHAILTGSDLPIFDAQFALNQFSGNQPLLLKILEKFIQQNQHFESLLRSHCEQEDIKAAKHEVHTIKGVSGNLGLNALHQASKEFEEKLANQVNKDSLQAFLNVFTQTLSIVQNYSAEYGVEVVSEVAAKADDKAELITALKRSEFISESKMNSYLQSIELSSEKSGALKQAIDNLDYVSAIKLLE